MAGGKKIHAAQDATDNGASTKTPPASPSKHRHRRNKPRHGKMEHATSADEEPATNVTNHSNGGESLPEKKKQTKPKHKKKKNKSPERGKYDGEGKCSSATLGPVISANPPDSEEIPKREEGDCMDVPRIHPDHSAGTASTRSPSTVGSSSQEGVSNGCSAYSSPKRELSGMYVEDLMEEAEGVDANHFITSLSMNEDGWVSCNCHICMKNSQANSCVSGLIKGTNSAKNDDIAETDEANLTFGPIVGNDLIDCCNITANSANDNHYAGKLSPRCQHLLRIMWSATNAEKKRSDEVSKNEISDLGVEEKADGSFGGNHTLEEGCANSVSTENVNGEDASESSKKDENCAVSVELKNEESFDEAIKQKSCTGSSDMADPKSHPILPTNLVRVQGLYRAAYLAMRELGNMKIVLDPASSNSKRKGRDQSKQKQQGSSSTSDPKPATAETTDKSETKDKPESFDTDRSASSEKGEDDDFVKIASHGTNDPDIDIDADAVNHEETTKRNPEVVALASKEQDVVDEVDEIERGVDDVFLSETDEYDQEMNENEGNAGAENAEGATTEMGKTNLTTGSDDFLIASASLDSKVDLSPQHRARIVLNSFRALWPSMESIMELSRPLAVESMPDTLWKNILSTSTSGRRKRKATKQRALLVCTSCYDICSTGELRDLQRYVQLFYRIHLGPLPDVKRGRCYGESDTILNEPLSWVGGEGRTRTIDFTVCPGMPHEQPNFQEMPMKLPLVVSESMSRQVVRDVFSESSVSNSQQNKRRALFWPIHRDYLVEVDGQQQYCVENGIISHLQIEEQLFAPLYTSFLRSTQKQQQAFCVLQEVLSRTLFGTTKFRDGKLHVYGSTLSQLSLKDSDVDLSLEIPFLTKAQESFIRGDMSKESYDRLIRDRVFSLKHILERRGFREVLAVHRARVPVVKAKYEHALRNGTRRMNGSKNDSIPCMSFDICFHNKRAVANSTLLLEYSLIDERVKMIMIVVKKWVRAQRIGSAADGTLSTYAWMNLVVFYLQCICFVPNLQCKKLMREHKHVEAEKVDGLDVSFLTAKEILKAKIWKRSSALDKVTTTSLLYGFYTFYHCAFRQAVFVVSIRLGRPSLLKTVFPVTKLWRLCIEDPFETYDSRFRHDLGMHVKESCQATISEKVRLAAETMARALHGSYGLENVECRDPIEEIESLWEGTASDCETLQQDSSDNSTSEDGPPKRRSNGTQNKSKGEQRRSKRQQHVTGHDYHRNNRQGGQTQGRGVRQGHGIRHQEFAGRGYSVGHDVSYARGRTRGRGRGNTHNSSRDQENVQGRGHRRGAVLEGGGGRWGSPDHYGGRGARGRGRGRGRGGRSHRGGRGTGNHVL